MTEKACTLRLVLDVHNLLDQYFGLVDRERGFKNQTGPASQLLKLWFWVGQVEQTHVHPLSKYFAPSERIGRST